MATRKEKMAEKVMRKVVETAFYKAAANIQIPMLSIPALYRAGEETYRACAMLPLMAAETATIVTERMTNEVAKVAVSR